MNAAAELPFAGQAEPGKAVSLVLAVSVHLLLLAFLFYGIRWQNQKPESIEVELVVAAPPVVEQPEPQVEQPPQAPVEPEVKPLPEPPKPEILQKEKEKPPPKEVRKPPSNPFQKQLEQELRQTKILKASEAANQELIKVQAAQAASALKRARDVYMAKIRDKIKSRIVLPPDLKGNPEALFDVVQLPSGEILSVTLRKSSGHEGYDAAVERAILKSSPLPRPDAPDIFSRELNLRFLPRDE